MRVRRILLISINTALLSGFWLISDEGTLKPHQPEAVSSEAQPVLRSSPSFRPIPASIARPLFRSEFSAPEQISPVAETKAVAFRLVGSIVTPGRHVALVETEENIRRVEEGGDLDGWQVLAITSRSIRITRAERIIDVPLDPPANPN